MAHVDALLYTRQSKAAGDDELAVLRQAEDGRALAKVRRWAVTKAFTDNDFSAAGKRYRPAFEAMLSEIETGRYGAVIAWALDRLTRNARDRLRLIEACAKHGVIIALVRGADIDPSSPGGRLVAGILGEVAEHEIAQKADRQRRAARQAAEAGLPYGGRRPFGFKADKITHEPAEAEALRGAYRDVLAGMPVNAKARALNEAGFTTTQATQDRHGCSPRCDARTPGECPQVIRGGQPSPWTGQALATVLLNPRYCGLRARTVRPEHGRPRWQIIGPARWEPIVSVDTFEAVKAILTSPERRHAPLSGQAMLTGVALCGHPGCDAPVHGGRSTRTKDKIYRCSATYGHLGRAQAPVDWYVGLVVCERLSRPDARDLLAPARSDLAPLAEELTAARTRLAQAPKLWAQGLLTDDELRDAKMDIGQRIAQLENQLAGDRRADLLRPLVTAEDVRAAWEGYDDDRRRAVIDTLMMVRILSPGRGTRVGRPEDWPRTFRPETVDIKWR
jgi:DNA invertase Pin-like site-specific DNA recombinase